MSGFNVQTNQTEVIIRLDRSDISQEKLINFLEYFRLEYLVLKAALTPDVLDIAADIETKWWEQNKEAFLKNTVQ
jgi:hypothetical protein